jgi:hypothetical protein
VTPDLVRTMSRPQNTVRSEQVLVLSREAQAAKTARAAPAQPTVRRTPLSASAAECTGAKRGNVRLPAMARTSAGLLRLRLTFWWTRKIWRSPDANITRYNAFKTRDWQISVHALVIQRLDLDWSRQHAATCIDNGLAWCAVHFWCCCVRSGLGDLNQRIYCR